MIVVCIKVFELAQMMTVGKHVRVGGIHRVFLHDDKFTTTPNR